MAMAEPDRLDHEVTSWLHLLYDGCDTGWLSLFSLDRRNGDRHVDWAPVDDYDALAEAAALRAPHCCVWLGMATRTRRLGGNQRGKADDCAELPGLWLDIDVAGPNHATDAALPPDREAAWALIGDFPLPPTAVVDSGGGLQAHWLFAEPLLVGHAAALLDRWGAKWTQLADARGWHLDNVFDVARVMRLPGTANRKGTPAPVTVVRVEDRRWGVDDLDQWLIDPPAPARSALEPRVPYIGPTRPGDAFNAQHGAAEVLAAHGWTHARTDRNGDQHWCRPGKEAREGSGATIYAEDGHCTIWTSTVTTTWPTLAVRRPYDAFGLFTHLAHRGDWRAASDELEARGYGTKARPDAIVLHPRPAVEGETAEDDVDDLVAIGSSWRRTDLSDIVAGLVDGTLEAPQPTLGRRVDGVGLWYPGRVNGLYGEPGKGKTWIAVAVAAEVLAAGGSVAWIDLEEPAPGLVGRLLDIGVDGQAVLDRFAHFAPEETIRHAAAMSEEVDALAPQLVVIDSTGEALALEGYGPNNDDEVATWFRTWPRWLATKTGAGVVVIDHVIKDETTRGLWPGGSQRKKAAINGSAFMASAIKELGRGVEGRLKLVTSKDRQGHHRVGTKAAEFVLDARGDGIDWRLEVPVRAPDGEPFRPTTLMGRVSDFLGTQAGPVSTHTVEGGVTGKAQHVRQALEVLAFDGYVTVTESGGGRWWSLVRAYSELDEMDRWGGAER